MSRPIYLILSLLLLAIGSYYLLFVESVPNATQQESAQKLFAEIPKEEVLAIKTIQPEGTYSIEKTSAGYWEMAAPVAGRLNPELVEAYLQKFFEIGYVAEVSGSVEALSAKDFGLHTPRSFVRIALPNHSETLSVGSKNKVSGRTYVRLESSGNYYLISNETYNTLFLDKHLLRERAPAVFKKDAVTRLVLLSPTAANIELFKEDSRWQMASWKRVYPSNSSAIEQAINSLRQAEAVGLLDAVGSEYHLYGLAQGASTIHLELEEANFWGERELTIRVGKGIGIAKSDEQMTEAQEGSLETKETIYSTNASDSVVMKFKDNPFAKFFDPIAAFRGKSLLRSGAMIQKAQKLSVDSTAHELICDSLQSCEVQNKLLHDISVEEFVAHIPSVAKAVLVLEVFAKEHRMEKTSILLQRIDGLQPEPQFFLEVVEKPLQFQARVSAESAEKLLSVASQ